MMFRCTDYDLQLDAAKVSKPKLGTVLANLEIIAAIILQGQPTLKSLIATSDLKLKG